MLIITRFISKRRDPDLVVVLLPLLLLLLLPVSIHSVPLACQLNEDEPMLPIFHIIGNVTPKTYPNAKAIDVEAINDVSGVTFYNGLYHIWHQCCQNHWDHVISRDLIHWQRLPPPIQPVTLKTWDGSITLLPAEDGGPLILYDAQDGKMGSHSQDPRVGSGDSPIVGVARLVDSSDSYLLNWTREKDNPVIFVGPPIAFPGNVWKNGQYWNFLGQGSRFQSNDSTFHTWTNMGSFLPNETHETSGQWWFPIPNQINGSPPPPGSPNRAVNVGNGADFLLGSYDPASETFKPWIAPGSSETEVVHLEKASASWFGASGGSDNNNRAMLIGWATPDFVGAGAGDGFSFLTRLTLLRELTWDLETSSLVSNPVPELLGLRAGVLASERSVPLSETLHIVPGTSGGAASSADVNITFSGVSANSSFGVCVLSNGQLGNGVGVYFGNVDEYYLPDTDIPGGDYNVTNVSYDDPHICQAQCTSDGDLCKAWTYVIRPPLVGSCCLKNVVDQQSQSATCTSGIKNSNPVPGIVQVRVGPCSETSLLSDEYSSKESTVRINADGTVNVRILPDRSVVDFFVNAGRWTGTQSWLDKSPRNATDSTVFLWASTGSGIKADIDVYEMGCGWIDPSYTDSPTL